MKNIQKLGKAMKKLVSNKQKKVTVKQAIKAKKVKSK